MFGDADSNAAEVRLSLHSITGSSLIISSKVDFPDEGFPSKNNAIGCDMSLMKKLAQIATSMSNSNILSGKYLAIVLWNRSIDCLNV